MYVGVCLFECISITKWAHYSLMFMLLYPTHHQIGGEELLLPPRIMFYWLSHWWDVHTRTNPHMVDVWSTHPPTYPHYTFQPCHLTLPHHSLTLLSTSSSQLASPNLNLPVTTPSRLRRTSWSTTQSQHAWGDQSSTHRFLTYFSKSRSTSWVGRKYCLCVFKHDTRIHMYTCTYTCAVEPP